MIKFIEIKVFKNRDIVAGKLTTNFAGVKTAIRKFTEIINSSRAVLFSTENVANSYKSAIIRQERT